MWFNFLKFISEKVNGNNFWIKYFLVVFAAYYIKYIISFAAGGVVSSAGWNQPNGGSNMGNEYANY